MSSRFRREMRKEMTKNVRGKKAERPTPCPNCGEQFRFPMEAVMFGGEVTCPHCQQTFNVGSDAADRLISGLNDFRRKLR
jgi:predicted Zn finger-like uncharacterized protein